ncbi:hypothetical protein [Aquimarina amphilecti]|nr:hypothetical protein [Aquimarina amphilecti]
MRDLTYIQGYDRYKNTWEDWDKNPLKKQAIDYYGLKGLEST